MRAWAIAGWSVVAAHSLSEFADSIYDHATGWRLIIAHLMPIFNIVVLVYIASQREAKR